MNTAQAQQFASLQKATANHNNDARMADHARRRESDMIVRASEQDRRDEEELRKAHGELGEETRKRKNLEVEMRRCRQASEADREAIIKITSELNGIEVRTYVCVRRFLLSSCTIPTIITPTTHPHAPPQADEREQKIQFVKEMEALNNENDFILTHREDKKLSHLLDAETANWLVGIELDDAVVAARNGMTDDDDGADEADNECESSSRWSEEVSARVKDGVADLIEIEGRGDDLTRKVNELEMFLQQLRARFLLEHSVS